MMLMHLLNAIGLALFSIVAFVQLLLVDKLLTLVVFVPLAIVIAVTQSLSARILRYRVASREATRRVTGAIGDIALFLYYLGFVTTFTQLFGELIAQYKQTGVSFERMQRLLQGAPVDTLVKHNPLYLEGVPPALTVPVIEEANWLETLAVHNLTYRYADTGRGIVQASFSLQKGMLTVVTGRVASGKTTLLRVLLGLLPKDEGEIHWNGEVVADPASFFVPPRSAYTPQVSHHLFSGTLAENILLGLPEDDAALQTAVRTGR
jgi:ATP-binding cassette subfamily B protein